MFKNSVWRLITQIGIMAFTLVTSTIVNRLLGPTNKGYYAIVNLTVSLIYVFGYLGLNNSISYYRAKRTFEDPQLWSFAVFFGVVWGIILGILGVFIVNFLLSDILALNSAGTFFLSVGLALIFAQLINSYLRFYVLGKKEFRLFNTLDLMFAVFQLFLLIFFVIVLPDNVIAVYLSWLMPPLIVAVILLIITKEKWSLSKISFRSIFRKNINYGYKTYITNFMQFLNYRLDQYILNYYSGPSAVGIYTVAVGLGGYLWQLSNAVQVIILPSVADLSQEQRNSLTARANRNTLFITLVGAVLLSVSGRWVIKFLFGPAYEDAYAGLIWLLPGIVAFSVVKILTASMAGAGHPEIGSIVTGFSFIFTIILDSLLIPKHGLIGAAQASTVAYSAGGALSIVLYWRHTKVSLKQLLLIQAEDLQICKKSVQSLRTILVQRRML